MTTPTPPTNSIPSYLTDDPGILAPVNDAYDWAEYALALTMLEQNVLRLFAEMEAADGAAEYSLSLADSGLESLQKSYKDLRSQVSSLQTNADALSAQILPVTGGQYTHLITESFVNTAVRDAASVYSRQPLEIQASASGYATGAAASGYAGGCSPRPDLYINTAAQSLELRREGISTFFTGIPGSAVNTSIGGKIEVDRIYGTPVESVSDSGPSSPWTLSVASRSPLAQGFSLAEAPLPSWIPDSYAAGSAVRIHARLNNPAPLTEIRLRGALLSGGGDTKVLETVLGIDSRPNPYDPASLPTRACNADGSFRDFTDNWTVLSGTVGFAPAPGRISSPDLAVRVSGLISQTFALPAGKHLLLRYRAAAPFTESSSPASAWQSFSNGSGPPVPTPPATAFVQVYFYAAENPDFGQDPPLLVETFRDAYPVQAGLYAGWAQFSHLLSVPPGTLSAYVVAGVDPILSQGISASQTGAAILYSDVWLCDEAITSSWSEVLPQPTETNLTGPTQPGGPASYVSEDAIDSLILPLGNATGTFIVTDAWAVLGQEAPVIDTVNAWKVCVPTTRDPRVLPPYQLAVPAAPPKGSNPNDPLLLHEARYTGQGIYETDDSRARLNGSYATEPEISAVRPLTARTGLPSSRRNRGGSRTSLRADSSPALGSYWKITTWRRPRKGFASLIATAGASWRSLYGFLVGIAKGTKRPPSYLLGLMAEASAPPPQDVLTGSLYVYTLGLTTLALIRQEYAPSGLYVTQPLRNIGITDSTLPAEIHEIGLLPTPPVPQLGQRVRFWAIPGSNATTNDSPGALLKRAVPLDSENPRATFHSTVELLPGVAPARSDIAKSFGVSDPAFYVTPSYYSQTLADGLDANSAAQGFQLDYIPYVNREAISQITATIAGSNSSNPNVYDPNAVRPIVDFLSNFDNGFVAPNQSSAAFGGDGGTLSTDPSSTVAPGTTHTLAVIPFLDNSQNPVSVPSNTSLYTQGATVTEGASAFAAPPSVSPNPSENALSLTLTAPTQVGTYTIDCVLNLLSGADGPIADTYVCHVTVNVAVPAVTSAQLVAVNGYRPFAVTVTTPSGRTIFPDSLGKPVPGEIVYEPLEVLQSALSVQTQDQPSSPAEYVGSTPNQPAASTQLMQTQKLSFVTAHSPVASGKTGVAISLFWHRSTEFDPLSGGVLTQYDIEIPPSDYVIDAHTGQITVLSTPPYNWAAYDQVIAQYFWVVGNVAPREWFPPPSIYDVQTISNPLGFLGTPPDTRPTTLPSLPSLSSAVSYPDLVQNPWFQYLSGPEAVSWGRIGGDEYTNSQSHANPNTLSPIGHVASLSSEITSVGSEGIFQTGIDYYGPGQYSLQLEAAAWANGGNQCTVLVEIYQDSYLPQNVLESYGPVAVAVDGSTPGFPWHLYPSDQSFYTATDIANATANLTQAQNADLSHPYKIALTIRDASSQQSKFNGTQIAFAQISAVVNEPIYTCPAGYQATPAGSNLLAHGDFESGNDFSTLTGGATVSGAEFHGGTHSLLIPTGGSASYVQNASPGDVYEMTFWANRLGFSVSFSVYNGVDGVWEAPYVIPFPGSTAAWASHDTGPFQILESGTTQIKVTFSNASGSDIYFDDASLLGGAFGSAGVCSAVPMTVSTSTTVDVTSGAGAGTVDESNPPPTDVADLLKGPISQSYPVTRNVTNYSASVPAAFTPPNFDSLSPDYYPVLEYRIDPGGVLRFATDMSPLGPFAGCSLVLEYDYLDINPRIAVEYLPLGQTPFSLPSTPTTIESLRSQVSTPELSNLQFLINARY